MGKIFWLDLETTGLEPRANGICQFAGLVELNGEIVEEIYVPALKPFPADRIDAKALEVNGLTREELNDGLDPRAFHRQLCEQLGVYVDKYNKVDKFVLAGYNVAPFDSQFLRAFFTKCGDKFFGSWFYGAQLDIMSFVAEAIARGSIAVLNNHKLGTVCQHCGIDLVAHNALEDVKATRRVYQFLRASR